MYSQTKYRGVNLSVFVHRRGFRKWEVVHIYPSPSNPYLGKKKKGESAHGLDLFIFAFHYFAVRVLTVTFYVAIPIAFTGQ